jgi:hypothetical protein
MTAEKPTGEHHKTAVTTVSPVVLASVLEITPVRPWTRRMFVLYAICLLAALNSCINGYDGSLMSAINAMKPYQTQFNMKATGAATGFVFAIYSSCFPTSGGR